MMDPRTIPEIFSNLFHKAARGRRYSTRGHDRVHVLISCAWRLIQELMQSILLSAIKTISGIETNSNAPWIGLSPFRSMCLLCIARAQRLFGSMDDHGISHHSFLDHRHFGMLLFKISRVATPWSLIGRRRSY